MAVRGPLTFGTGAITLTLDGTGQTFTTGSVYDYYIASATGYDNLNTANVTFSPVNFSTLGSFALGVSGADLVVSFTPVPEPSAIFGVAALAVGVGGFVRKRFRPLSRNRL